MNNDWIKSAIQAGQNNTAAPKEIQARDTDPLRQKLHKKLESLLEKSFPTPLDELLSSLNQEGFHLFGELQYEPSSSTNPLAVGFSGERFAYENTPVSWRTLRLERSIWVSPRAYRERKKDFAVIAVEAIPTSEDSISLRVTVNGHKIVTDPDKINIDIIRGWVEKNIESGRTPNS